MIRLVPTEYEHFDGLKLKAIFEHKDAIEFGRTAVLGGAIAYTLLAGAEVLAIFGGKQEYPGVLNCWGLFSEEIRKYKIAFHRAAKILIDVMFKEFKLHRMQAAVRTDYTEGQRWIEALGFVREGWMKMYGAERHDYFMYGRTV